MKQLTALQNVFQRHVHRPARAMEHAVLATARAGAARRLSIYADAYRSRLVEALATDYPALREWLGADEFKALVLAFVAAHPSRFANLRWYGGDLARFLARSPVWRKRPLLAELAAFEWALGLAFDAADAPLLEAGALANVPARSWPALTFRLHPSVQRLALRGDAPRMWQWAQDRGRRPAPAMRREPVAWIVWRKGFAPFYRALPADEAWALAAVARGRNFGAVCGGLRRFTGAAGAAQRAAQLLRNWLAEGLICGFEANR